MPRFAANVQRQDDVRDTAKACGTAVSYCAKARTENIGPKCIIINPADIGYCFAEVGGANGSAHAFAALRACTFALKAWRPSFVLAALPQGGTSDTMEALAWEVVEGIAWEEYGDAAEGS